MNRKSERPDATEETSSPQLMKGNGMPRVIKVIQSDECRGNGTKEYPYRNVTVYYTLDGDWLADNDPHIQIVSAEPTPSTSEVRGEN